MKSKKITAYDYGFSSEKIAAEFLTSKGFEILKKRFKTKFGEIDLIAKKDDLVIFVEVKGRKTKELIEVILTKHQTCRIKNAAMLFVAQNLQYQNFNLRFDFILFNGSSTLEHFEGFWE